MTIVNFQLQIGGRNARAAHAVLSALSAIFFCAGAAGCHSLGPGTVPRDRSEYAASISDSWKRQALLNIVKMRYLDPPIFVDVGQIVSGYTLETSVQAGGSFPETTNFGGNTATVNGAARYTDRPTITYTPLTGNRFIKSLMAPLPPDSVFSTIQSGWPADGVLMSAVASINGLKNQETAMGALAPPDPKFLRVTQLMRQLQLSGTVGLRVAMNPERAGPGGKEGAEQKEQGGQTGQEAQTMLLTFRTKDATPETIAASRELRQLLRLDPDATSFRLVVGAVNADDKEIAVQTRSVLHLMQTMASQIEVAPADLAEGRATPGWESIPPEIDSRRLIRIHSSATRPRASDSFVDVNYRKQWFWIDDRDLRTKRAFGFMLILFTLADTGQRDNLPLVTIPAQ